MQTQINTAIAIPQLVIFKCTECGCVADNGGHNCGEVFRTDRLNLVMELQRAKTELVSILGNLDVPDKDTMRATIKETLEQIKHTLKMVHLTDREIELLQRN